MRMVTSRTERPGMISGLRGLRARLLRALASCVTEADIAQVLYAELHAVFGYYVVNLQILEQEGWYHSLPVDHGVLQDIRRRRVAESMFAPYYGQPKPVVIHPSRQRQAQFETGRGPGVRRRGRTLIWVPILYRGGQIGSGLSPGH